MDTPRTFNQILADDLEKYAGIRRPLKASLAERRFVKSLPCLKLHANPDDEFSMKEIGPNGQIIEDYKRTVRAALTRGGRIFDEPLTVEKMSPDGYMLLNGHHRWAAAVSLGVPRIRVKIVNPTHEEDILKMIDRSRNDKRVSFDLDEVLMSTDPAVPHERLSRLKSLLYRRPMRLGAPALISDLRKTGYDVWVYSSGYLSGDDIRRLLRLYGITVDGIISGVKTGKPGSIEKNEKIREQFEKKFRYNIHVDGKSVVWVDSNTRDFDVTDLKGDARSWSRDVREILRGREKAEQTAGKA